jgi:hypothetical protein
VADRIAIPGTGLNFTSASSWADATAATSWGTSDRVIFPSGYRYEYTSGLSTGLTGVTISSLIAEPGAVVILSDTLAMDIDHSGGAGLQLLCKGEFRFSGDTSLVSATNPELTLSLLGGAHPTVLASQAARVYMGSSATVGDVAAMARGRVELASHGSDRIATARVSTNGSVETARSVEAGIIAAGSLKLIGAAGITDGSTGGAVDLVDRSAYLYAKLTSAPTLKRLRAYEGTFDPSESRVSLTLDNDLQLEGAAFVEYWGAFSLTRTAPVRVAGRGSRVYAFAPAITDP